MYKIFSNDKCLCLIDNKSLFVEKNTNRLLNYSGKQQLKKEYEFFLSDETINNLYVFHPDLKQLWNDYSSIFKLVSAAGGVVKNNKGELLLIFRHKRWDLPKGKIEKNETVKVAAIREVQEECGLHEIEISKELPVTYHTYLLNEIHVLKKTFWFEMYFTGKNLKLTPQLEENITDARWMNVKEMRSAIKNTYPLIREVLNSF